MMSRRGALLSMLCIFMLLILLTMLSNIRRASNLTIPTREASAERSLHILRSLEIIFEKLTKIDDKLTKQQQYNALNMRQMKVTEHNNITKLHAATSVTTVTEYKINPLVILDEVEKNMNIHYKLLVLVSSYAPHSDRRNTIRDMWGSKKMWNENHSWKVVFVLGKSKDETMMSKLHKEAEENQDIIIEGITEDFYRLSYKVMIGLKWSHANFNYDFILKCDDDVFVQIDRILNLISNDRNKEIYFGQVMIDQPVMRKGRYALSKKEHEKDKFDPYCSGGGFILSYKSITKIIPLFNWEKPLKIDDAYIGQLINTANINATHNGGFDMWNAACEYKDKLLVSHPVKTSKCMEFLQKRSLIDNGKLVNDILKKQKSPKNNT